MAKMGIRAEDGVAEEGGEVGGSWREYARLWLVRSRVEPYYYRSRLAEESSSLLSGGGALVYLQGWSASQCQRSVFKISAGVSGSAQSERKFP